MANKNWLDNLEEFFIDDEENINSGRFVKGSDRARIAGRKGGKASSGKFTEGSLRAKQAGRKGGRKSR